MKAHLLDQIGIQMKKNLKELLKVNEQTCSLQLSDSISYGLARSGRLFTESMPERSQGIVLSS